MRGHAEASPEWPLIRRLKFGGFVAWARWFCGHFRPLRGGGNHQNKEKARRPVSRVLSTPPEDGDRWPFIWDARYRTPRATYPGGGAETRLPEQVRRVAPIWSCSRWGLPCRPRYRRRGALLPHPFTLATGRSPFGGLLSVALSLGSPPPAVNRHRVSVEPGLSSPPGRTPEERPSDRLAGPNLARAAAGSRAATIQQRA